MALALMIVLTLCLAGTSSAQTTQQKCSDLTSKMNDLKTAIEGICASSPSAQYNWTPVTKTSIGSSNLKNASTISFTIPSVIPSTAKEVLIFVGANSGYSNRGPYHDLTIYTQIGTQKYEKFLTLYSWNQAAINTNSDNMWFPMPTNRMVYLTVPAAHGDHAEARLFAIGYR